LESHDRSFTEWESDMSEPLKPVAWGCQFQDGTVCTYDYDQDKAERTALLNGGKAITLYTESQLEAARAEGRRAGLEEAAMLCAGLMPKNIKHEVMHDELPVVAYTRTTTRYPSSLFCAQAIRALADKDKT
jgi:hypothetical protein